MARTFQIRRGNVADIPSLATGEPGFTLDGKKLYIGHPDGNVQISSDENYTTAEKDKLNGIAEGANKYTHPTTAGNKHIPSGGSDGQILRYNGSSGTAKWDDEKSYSEATQSAAGLLGTDDKKKLDAVDKGITTAGDGSAFTATVPGITALEAGASFIMVPHIASSVIAPTLNVNGLGAKAIRRRISGSTASTLATGSSTNWIAKGKPMRVTYNGSYWIPDMDKPNANDIYGTIKVPAGGTGLSTITADSFMVGNGTEVVKLLTPAEVLTKIGAADETKVAYYKPTLQAPNDLLDASVTQTSYVNTEDASTLINSPVTSGAFYAIREVFFTPSAYNVNNNHILITLKEVYPQRGRVWSRMYDVHQGAWNTNDWICNVKDFYDTSELNFHPYHGSNLSSLVMGAINQSGSNITAFRPGVNNSALLGSSVWRWSKLWTNGIDTVSAVNVSSDRRIKDNISYDTDDMIGIFENLDAASFTLNELNDGKKHYGFVAQDIIAALEKLGLDPEAIGLVSKIDLGPEVELPEDYGERTRLSVGYSELTPILWAVAKVQKSEIDDLKKEQVEQKTTIEDLKKVVEDLKFLVKGE